MEVINVTWLGRCQSCSGNEVDCEVKALHLMGLVVVWAGLVIARLVLLLINSW